ncbi:hypothetical protein SAMN05216214_107112 [Atopomonas hussainii]|uniref:Uncharacterized protein n=1 Tax=Atopomonas hussainii TaxID=1429083 RepID=A0A1H7LSF4_9GAMM|nr:hypothetical protein [Atopomonas hussainii]SEL01914.1 hypothetical protein SAMN05216214_107112 [Atopomonas hussainii]
MWVVVPLLILFAHLVFSAWQKGEGYFYSTQVSLWGTFLCWLVAFDVSEAEGVSGLLIVFSLLSLMVNMRFVTMTSIYDLKYQGLTEFKRFCLRKGYLTRFESFTVAGLYWVVGGIWVFALVKIAEKFLIS